MCLRRLAVQTKGRFFTKVNLKETIIKSEVFNLVSLWHSCYLNVIKRPHTVNFCIFLCILFTYLENAAISTNLKLNVSISQTMLRPTNVFTNITYKKVRTYKDISLYHICMYVINYDFVQPLHTARTVFISFL